MKVQDLSVLSLRPDPANPLGLDLKHILPTFGHKLADWVWCVKDLDWLGEDAESFCRAVEAAGPGGSWIDSRDLVEKADQIYQTIEGEFIAFPGSIDRRNFEPLDLDLSSFPSSRAVVAVAAVDGCYFDIYLKDAELTSMVLARFPDATAENTEFYF